MLRAGVETEPREGTYNFLIRIFYKHFFIRNILEEYVITAVFKMHTYGI